VCVVLRHSRTTSFGTTLSAALDLYLPFPSRSFPTSCRCVSEVRRLVGWALDTQRPVSVSSTSKFGFGLVQSYVSVCVMVVLGNAVI
jgi:hypothetical protein